MQVSGKERKVANESLFRDVAKIVSEKCINTETHHAYTVTMIEKMMRDCHVNLQSKKSPKQQVGFLGRFIFLGIGSYQTT